MDTRFPSTSLFRWTPLLVIFGLACQSALAQKESQAVSADVIPITANKTELELAERFSKVIQLKNRALRVDGFDPSVVTVQPISPTLLRIYAESQGVTTIIVTDEMNRTQSIEVFVAGDARMLQAVLNRTFPSVNVRATRIRDSILLRGWVTEPQQISQIVDVARLHGAEVLNFLRVGGPQEVQLRVKVLEVQRTKTRQLGLNFTVNTSNAAIASTPGPITPLNALTTSLGTAPTLGLASSGLGAVPVAIGFVSDSLAFQGLVQAMKDEGLLKIQAEPVLTTRSGEAARIINGGEFPIPVPQSLGTVTIEWREFGVTLESLPIVLSPTRLKQQLTVEVSERDFSTAVTLSGTVIPGLTKRTLQTQAEMNFGETLVVGGLINTRNTAETHKIPVLGDMPGVGAAFRKIKYAQAETELVVMITPEYASAVPSDAVPPGGPGLNTDTPTDKELYCQGLLEVPRYHGSGSASSLCPQGTCQPGGRMQGAPPPSQYQQGYAPAPGAPVAPSVNPGPTEEPGLIAPQEEVPPSPSNQETSRRSSKDSGTRPASYQETSREVNKTPAKDTKSSDKKSDKKAPPAKSSTQWNFLPGRKAP